MFTSPPSKEFSKIMSYTSVPAQHQPPKHEAISRIMPDMLLLVCSLAPQFQIIIAAESCRVPCFSFSYQPPKTQSITLARFCQRCCCPSVSDTTQQLAKLCCIRAPSTSASAVVTVVAVATNSTKR